MLDMAIQIDQTPAGYDLFLRCKTLPHYEVRGNVVWTDEVSYGQVFQATDDGRLSSSADHLFDYQRHVTDLALEKRRYAAFLDCGLGKTAIELAWAHAVAERKGRVLFLCPLSVMEDVQRFCERFYGYRMSNLRSEPWKTDIAVMNWESMRELEGEKYAGIVLDECFPAGTMIDTPSGRMGIEKLRIGDTIQNASGTDILHDVHRREVSRAIKLTIDGHPIVSSPNHPYFTGRGWVCAQDIVPGERVMRTADAVRMVRGDVLTEVIEDAEILRQVLLSEMADEAAGDTCEGSLPGGGSEEGQIEGGMVRGGWRGGDEGKGAAGGAEPCGIGGSEGADLPHIESHEPQTFRAWGQWDRHDEAASVADGCSWRRMDAGVCLVAGQVDSRVSNELQNRLGAQRAANRYRSGWSHASVEEGPGREEGCKAAFARVDSLEVLELGHPELERLRDADGRIYFYDLGATRHPSYSINGLLVHNSGILKNGQGVTRKWLTRLGHRAEYRLAASATPSPNEQSEYATHAVWLGMSSTLNEFYGQFFRKDGTDWRLKRHAVGPFYRNLRAWCCYINRPSQLGFQDTDAEMTDQPDYRVLETSAPDVLSQGTLFTTAVSMSEAQAVFRMRSDHSTPRFRDSCDAVAGKRSIVWCARNAEEQAFHRELGGHLVTGTTPIEERVEKIDDFRAGRVQTLVSKPAVLGFGVNIPDATDMLYSGYTWSFEQFYQAVRRAHRYGRTGRLKVHVPVTDEERPVWRSLQGKMATFDHDVEMLQRSFGVGDDQA